MTPEESKKDIEIFYRGCGEILRMALHIENDLDFFLMEYFIQPQCQKSFFFRDEVLTTLNFNIKIKLFNAICKEENVENNLLKNINKNIADVVKIRNALAHREAYIDNPEEGIKILTKKGTRIIRKEDKKKVTDDLVKEIDEKRLAAIKGINGILMDLYTRNKKQTETN